jgi:hypothetical protein
MFGRRRLFFVGAGIFAVFSAVAALALVGVFVTVLLVGGRVHLRRQRLAPG